ncbi:MAG: hypothetical protein D6732_20605, partial [Methanobacteriota archaeon]
MEINPVNYVHSLAEEISSTRTQAYKSKYSQYFTPRKLTDFILNNCNIESPPRSFLDPAAGVGNLLVSLIIFCVEKFSDFYKGRTIATTAYEIDKTLEQPLRDSLMVLKKYLKENYDCQLNFSIFIEDFVDSSIALLERKKSLEPYLQDTSDNGEFEAIILNPPYKKIKNNHPRLEKIKKLTGGHNNLYTAFLGLCKNLLSKNGYLIGIVPRSFTNGFYFKDFREKFLKDNALLKIFVVEERDEAFSKDQVLQENIVIFTQKKITATSVIVETISINHSVQSLFKEQIPYENVILPEDSLICIPSTKSQVDSLLKRPSNSKSLKDLLLTVSTGQVVQHRTRKWLINPQSDHHFHLLEQFGKQPIDAYPLILANHIFPLKLNFPRKNLKKKVQFLKKDYTKYRVPVGTYLLIRRMSTKEDNTRLICTLITKEDFPHIQYITFDNKINFIDLNAKSKKFALGLLYYLNSNYVDNYIRAINGSTQINSTDFKYLPFPDSMTLEKLGEIPPDQQLRINELIASWNCLKKHEINQLVNDAIRILKDLEITYEITDEKAAIILLTLTGIKHRDWALASSKPYTINNEKNDFLSIIKRAKNRFDYIFKDREEIRRKCLHHFIQQGLVIQNEDKPDRAINSSYNNYRLTPQALNAIRAFNTPEWHKKSAEFIEFKSKLTQNKRPRNLLPVNLINSEGKPIVIEISKGKHSELQKDIVEKFTATNFVKKPIVVFVDDTGKNKYWDQKICKKLGIEIDVHSKLPDVIIYDQEKDWLFLFEAFVTHGPIDEKRRQQLIS